MLLFCVIIAAMSFIGYLCLCRHIDTDTYENDLVQELESELKMEEFLKQRRDAEKAYMVRVSVSASENA